MLALVLEEARVGDVPEFSMLEVVVVVLVAARSNDVEFGAGAG